MAVGKPEKGRDDQSSYRLELVGFKAGVERPVILVQAVDQHFKVFHSERVKPDGTFTLPADVLKKAQQVVLGAAGDKGELAAGTSVRLRASEFGALAQDGTIALAEGTWSKFLISWECVSGRVQVCRRRPWWFDRLIAAATAPVVESATGVMSRAFAAVGSTSASVVERVQPSVNDLLIWPYRCYTVCLGTVEVYRRRCCCWPIVVDDWRIPDLIRDLENIVEQLPKVPPKFPPPPPPPIDPLATPIFKGGALNELALNAANDLRVLRSLPRDQAAQYISSRLYLLRTLCSCGSPVKVATGTIQPDGTFNICWLEPLRLIVANCHDEYAYVVKQTIGGTSTTIYDGVTAGIWFHAGDDAVLSSYNGRAFDCSQTGTGDGTAYVYLDLVGDTESHLLTTPASTGWDRVAAPGPTSGLLFPTPTTLGHLRNLGRSIELTFNFSEGMKDPAIGAKYYRVSISRADPFGNPVGPRYYYGQGLHPASDGLTWQKAVITMTGIDIVPETLGPVSVGTQNHLYRIPFDSDADWTGSVRYHALIYTLNTSLNVPDAADLASAASNHLVTLEVFNAAGERLRPLGVPASGESGVELTKAFKFRRWFQAGGSVGDDTVEVPFAALTHLFCWDNRAPEADITRLVENGVASDEECQFLVEPGSSTFGIEYRAYVPDERFQRLHRIRWVRGLNGSAANGGVGSLPTPLSPTNVGKPPAAPVNSGTNTFEQMLTRINPDLSTTVLERCSFAVTLTTFSKTTDGEDFDYPWDQETAAFALQIE
jgi:hypothetical protein